MKIHYALFVQHHVDKDQQKQEKMNYRIKTIEANHVMIMSMLNKLLKHHNIKHEDEDVTISEDHLPLAL